MYTLKVIMTTHIVREENNLAATYQVHASVELIPQEKQGQFFYPLYI
jgi:hypothetical protein